MVNSRAKGNDGERAVCKILSQWWGGHWERRSMGVPGPDLVTPDDFPWAVEVKNHKTIHPGHFWYPTKMLQDWWWQASRQATQCDRLPLLVVKALGDWYVVYKPYVTHKLAYSVSKLYQLPRPLYNDDVLITTLTEFTNCHNELKRD